MKIIFKKPLRFTVIATLCLVFVGLFVTYSCDKHEKPDEDKHEKSEIKHVKTELGGCNKMPNIESVESEFAFRSVNLEMNTDTVIITISEDSISVFVNLHYICKVEPFETRIEIIGDVIHMYIIDGCVLSPDNFCYKRCMCDYTFDFIFTQNGEINQKYKIVLIDPRKENPIIVSEGIITNSTNL